MTSSRQSAAEGKRLVRRRTSDLTLSGTCASKDTLGEAHGVASRSVDQARDAVRRFWSFFEAFAHARLLENGTNGAVADLKPWEDYVAATIQFAGREPSTFDCSVD